MSDDTIYAEYTPELFEAASELMMNKYFMAKKIQDQQIYDLTIKALDYYKQYMDENRPYDSTTSTYTASSPAFLPYKEDTIVIPKNAITSWEVTGEWNGIRHSKVEFLDRALSTSQYESY